jgi:glucan phosphoethanolaminetransferase (alkaline phosphatase superfamily)
MAKRTWRMAGKRWGNNLLLFFFFTFFVVLRLLFFPKVFFSFLTVFFFVRVGSKYSLLKHWHTVKSDRVKSIPFCVL